MGRRTKERKRDALGRFVYETVQPVSPEERSSFIQRAQGLEIECRARAVALHDMVPALKKAHARDARKYGTLFTALAAPCLYVYFAHPDKYWLFVVISGFMAFSCGGKALDAARRAAQVERKIGWYVKSYLSMADRAKHFRLVESRTMEDRRHWATALAEFRDDKAGVDSDAPHIGVRELETASNEVMLSLPAEDPYAQLERGGA